jgi:ribonuclease J
VGAEKNLPDLDLLAEYRDRIRAYIITHGHEDHVGAVEYASTVCPAPVYATPFVCQLVGIKHEIFGRGRKPDIHPVCAGDVITVGPFEIEFIRVTHSIPDSCALAITTPVGIVIHTGDFRLDDAPFDGQVTDMKRFRELGDQGVRLLLQDSTNAQIEGRTKSDVVVQAGLDKVIAEAKGRIIISLFASNAMRVRTLIDLAANHGRRTALVGRSLTIYNDAYNRAFGTRTPSGVVDERNVERIPGDELMVLCTGSQAEPRSVLARASNMDHPDLRIHPGDTIVFSSRIIPGNEKGIFRMINNLTRLGATIVNERNANVHGSGHAQRDELTDMIHAVRPEILVPMHGEYRFMVAHKELAESLGVEDVRLLENGHQLEISRHDAIVTDHLSLNFHYVDGPLVGDADELCLADRRRIGWNGVVAATLKITRGRREWNVGLKIAAVGIPFFEESTLQCAREYAIEQLEDMPIDASKQDIEDTLDASLRSYVRRITDHKPTILHFVEFIGE